MDLDLTNLVRGFRLQKGAASHSKRLLEVYQRLLGRLSEAASARLKWPSENATREEALASAQRFGCHAAWSLLQSEGTPVSPSALVTSGLRLLEELGISRSVVLDLIPDRQLVLAADRYLEYDGRELTSEEEAAGPQAVLLQGLYAGLMDFAFGGAYSPREPGLFRFRCEQLMGLECGDQCGIFVVKRR